MTTSIPRSSGYSYPPIDRPGGADIERGLGIPYRREWVPPCGTSVDGGVPHDSESVGHLFRVIEYVLCGAIL